MFAACLYLTTLIFLCESASVHQKNRTLETLRNDVSEVSNAIENFTFDVLEGVFSGEDDQVEAGDRRKRSTDEDVWKLCRKRCQEQDSLGAKQIKDLKLEMKKLQEIVQVLRDQQKVLDVLDHKNDTSASEEDEKHPRSEAEDDGIPNNTQLALIKTQLEDVIVSLNQTKVEITEQKRRDGIMEAELVRQNEEIEALKKRLEVLSGTNETSASPKARSSELSGLRKLLKSLPDDDVDDDVDNDDIHAKILQLEKQLKKKRRQENLTTELKQLEKSLAHEDDSKDLVQKLVKALKTEPKSRTDGDITNLSELQQAINNLQPKQEDNAQFQAMLSQLINQPAHSQKPQQINRPPSNSPYICVMNEGFKNNGYRAPPPPPPYAQDPQKTQFFPGQSTQPNYYAQPNPNGNTPEKTLTYPAENGAYNQKYRDDLRQQIDGLQAAIDNLNRPEYAQRPEDKAVVDDLERQIGDLRGVVQNLNYDNYQSARPKRSPDNNKVDESSEIVEQISQFLNNFKSDNATNATDNELENIQNKIDSIKKQLDTNPDSKLRSSVQEYPPPPPIPNLSSYFALQPQAASDLRKTSKNDFFLDFISNILDKLVSAIPVVIQKLFRFSVDELSKYDYQDYDVQVLFKNLGVFAYLPVILIRLLRGLTSFLSILKKNNFFKNFLMPAIILGTVAGSILFLVWWLQPEDQYSNNYTPYPDQPYNPQPPPQPQYQYPSTPNPPTYSRSYFNK